MEINTRTRNNVFGNNNNNNGRGRKPDVGTDPQTDGSADSGRFSMAGDGVAHVVTPAAARWGEGGRGGRRLPSPL